MRTLPELLGSAAAGTLPPLDAPTQRWRRRRHSYRRTSEGGFNPRRYQVGPVDEADAALFVMTHHYLASFPAAVQCWGLFERRHLVGVAVLGVPVNKRVLTRPFPDLRPYTQSLALSRLVLLDDVPANAESWFVAKVFHRAGKAGLRGVVAYSDPMRVQVGDRVITPGHVGAVYQALSGRYVGDSAKRTRLYLPDGTVLDGRSATKVRKGEPGAAGVVTRLRGYGVALPAWRPGIDGAAWLTEATGLLLLHGGARQVRHPGCFTYLWPVGTPMQRLAATTPLPARDYPKKGELRCEPI